METWIARSYIKGPWGAQQCLFIVNVPQIQPSYGIQGGSEADLHIQLMTWSWVGYHT